MTCSTNLRKRVLWRASVFAGGFTLDAAEAMCAGEGVDEFEVLDLLDSLVRKSLVTVERGSDEARYSLLETIRQFGEEQLGAHEEGEAARDAHAQFFADAATATYERWESAEQKAAGDWFKQELDNLRAAFHWALETDQIELVAAVLMGSYRPLWQRMNLETTDWATDALETAREADSPRLPDLLALASWCVVSGDLLEGQRYAEEAVQLYASVPVGHRNTWAWACLVFVALFDGRHDDAIAIAKEGADLPEDMQLGLCAYYVSLSYALSGRETEATSVAKEISQRASRSTVPFARALAHYATGWALKSSDPAMAAHEFRRVVDLFESGGLSLFEGEARLNLASIQAMHGEPHDALSAFDRTIDSCVATGLITLLRYTLGLMCVLLGRLERPEAVATLQSNAAAWMVASPADAARFNTAVEHARAALGEADFQRIQERASEMTLREATAYAREQIRQLLDELGEPEDNATDPG